MGNDAARRDRLQREFARVWAATRAPAVPAPVPAAPAPRETPRPLRVEVGRKGASPVVSSVSQAPRRLQLLCPACERLDVWLADGVISCHHCGREYDDMLALVPVKPVGPFEYVFGEGPMGLLKAAGVALLLLAVYGVLKWV